MEQGLNQSSTDITYRVQRFIGNTSVQNLGLLCDRGSAITLFHYNIISSQYLSITVSSIYSNPRWRRGLPDLRPVRLHLQRRRAEARRRSDLIDMLRPLPHPPPPIPLPYPCLRATVAHPYGHCPHSPREKEFYVLPCLGYYPRSLVLHRPAHPKSRFGCFYVQKELVFVFSTPLPTVIRTSFAFSHSLSIPSLASREKSIIDYRISIREYCISAANRVDSRVDSRFL